MAPLNTRQSGIAQFKSLGTSLRQPSASACHQNAQQTSTKRNQPTLTEETASEPRSGWPVGTLLDV